MIRRFLTSLLMVLAICGSLSSAEMAHRVRTCTWDGGGADALASNALNWDTDVAPVTGDSIVFPTTTKACTWDISTSLAAFTVNSGYVQTITQNSGANFNFSGAYAVNGACTITCNAGATTTCAAFSMTAGTFNQGGSFTSTTFSVTAIGNFQGGSTAMSTTAVTFSGTGGGSTIRATSGTWSLAGSWTQSTSLTTFTHNSGTITITAAATITDTRSTFSKFTVNSSGSVTIAASTTAPFGASPTSVCTASTLTINGTLTYSGTWNHTGTLATGNGSTVTGSSTPSLTISGSLTLNSTSTWTSVNVLCNGSTSTTYTDTGAKNSGTWTITKTGNFNFTVAASTSMSLGASPTVALGTGAMTVSGTLTYSGTFTRTGNLTVNSGATVTGSSSPTLVSDGNLTIDPAATWTSVNVLAQGGTNGCIYTDTGAKNSGTWTINQTVGFTISASTTCAIGASPSTSCGTGAFTVTGTVTVSGAWSCTGTLSVGAAGVVSGALTSMTTTRNVTLTAGCTFPTGVVMHFTTIGTVNAPGITFGTSTIAVASTFTVAASTTVPLGANPTTSASTLTISGTITCTGTIAHTGDFLLNSTGTISGPSTLTIIEGSWTFTAGGVMPATFNITHNITGGTARQFTGASQSYGTLTRMGAGTGSLTIQGSNTFTSVIDNDGLAAHNLRFTAGTTQTAATFLLSGSSGNIITINTNTPASPATLHRTDGLNTNAAWLSVQDITVDARPEWFAGDHSTSVSGNSNWLFVINPRLRKWAGF